jgi:hypothetical protein
MGISLTAQVGKLEILRLLFMPSFLLFFGWIVMVSTMSSDESTIEMWYFAVVMWVFALWPAILLWRAIWERIQGKNRVVIDMAGITLGTLGHQTIAWSWVDSIEVRTRQTMDYAGTNNIIINLLRTDYRVYCIKLNEAGHSLSSSEAPLEIVPLALSVSAVEVDAALASWLVTV